MFKLPYSFPNNIFTYILWVFSSRHGVIYTQGFQKLLFQDDVAEPGNTNLSIKKYTLEKHVLRNPYVTFPGLNYFDKLN